MKSSPEHQDFMSKLQKRFEKNMHRHPGMNWVYIEALLTKNPNKLNTIALMEESGGEPDVVILDQNSSDILFCDCSKETPKGRKSLCYDLEAWNSRKEHKPQGNVIDHAEKMGLSLLTEVEYFALQKLETFDTKTSSWLKTPDEIRKLGGAIFGDHRFGRSFIYHNGAESYYSSRGYRGKIKL